MLKGAKILAKFNRNKHYVLAQKVGDKLVAAEFQPTDVVFGKDGPYRIAHNASGYLKISNDYRTM